MEGTGGRIRESYDALHRHDEPPSGPRPSHPTKGPRCPPCLFTSQLFRGGPRASMLHYVTEKPWIARSVYEVELSWRAGGMAG